MRSFASTNPALLIIDVQKGIDESMHWGGNRNNPEAEGNIRMLLERWRSNGLPVIIVRHDSVSDASPFHPSRSGNALKDFIFAIDGEKVISKNKTNAFIGTTLLSDLKAMRVTELVITGFITNNSVESTARMSGESGFATWVVSDATATFDRTAADETKYPAELVHQISLLNLAGEFANIATTREIIESLTKSEKTS